MAKATSGWPAVLMILAGTVACTEPSSDDEGGTETGTETETDTGGDDEADSACNPSVNVPCSGGLTCCSDDPAALDLALLDAFVTPEYQGGAGQGTPLFSGGNNPLSIWGTCVDVSDAPGPRTLDEPGVMGCPIPCNPRWTAEDTQEVCGPSSQCCQTRAIEFDDCVLDPGLGNNGCWRPVTGMDILGLGGIDASQWKDSEHSTHQDPSGNNCLLFVSGISPTIFEQFGTTEDEVLRACFRRLGVATSRGYCMDVGTTCTIDPSLPDACELRNEQEGRTDCADLLP
jgi:hypothetical protein